MPNACDPRCHVNNSSSTTISLANILSGNASGGNASPQAGETYYVRVSAINSAGKTISGWQDTPLQITLPDAEYSNVKINAPTNITASNATLNWNAIPRAAGYRIYWSTVSSMPSSCEPTCEVYELADVGNASSPSIKLADVVGNVRNGAVYYIKISAVNEDGRAMTGWQPSPTSVNLTGSAVALPSTVQNIRTVSSDSSGTTIGWNAVPTATKHRIYYAPSSSMPSSCEPYCEVIVPSDRENPTFKITSSSRRYVKISAITTENGRDRTITGWQSSPFDIGSGGGGGDDGDTDPSVVSIQAPSDVSADDATLNWRAVNGAASYRVYWSTVSSMPSRCEPTCQVYDLADVGGSDPSISLAEVVGNIRPGGVYYVKISAVGSNGRAMTGWQSSPRQVNLSGSAAALPSLVSGIEEVSKDGSGITIGWNAVPTATKYRIYYSPSSSMPGRCEPYCELTVPSNRANPTFKITNESRRYVKISAVTTENGNDRTITGWQSSPFRTSGP